MKQLNKTFFFFILFFIGFFSLPQFSFAQGEARLWYFGYKAGLDFSSGSPVALSNGMMSTDEGSASISDAAGNLLFYTDGTAVWDRTHDTMPNGLDLMGSPSSTQSSVIIQKPGSTSVYYIFTADAQHQPNGIRYSEVNMTLRGGLGDVVATKKNILLQTPSCEKITGVRHCNNSDVWVVTHDFFGNAFRTFLVTSSGVNLTPVISNVGNPIDTSGYEIAGQLKADVAGKWIAMAKYGSTLELFAFNNSSGVVSHPVLFNPSKVIGVYGVEFSPDGTKLYSSRYYPPAEIYQMDLCAGSDSAIAYSPVLIAISANYGGCLQLGPDKKIYLGRYGANIDSIPYLGVIHNPDAAGTACNFIDDGVALGSRFSSLGLPNFVPYNLKPLPSPFTSAVNCLNGSFSAPTVNLTNCSNSTNAITSLLWDFGDPASGSNNSSSLSNPTHAFTNAGTYTVSLALNYACGGDIITQLITAAGPTAHAESDATIFAGASVSLQASGNGTYLWTTGDTSSSITVSPATTTNYCVTVTDTANCTNKACVKVTVRVPIEIPNAFSPNGDNINDTWNIKGIDSYGTPQVSIYNRWGQPVLYKSDYKTPWDGKQNGIELPTASYYYLIDINDGEFVYKGYLTLKR